MRILFLIDNLGSGGAQRQIVTLATLIKEIHSDISILTYSKENFFIEKVFANDIKLEYIKSNNLIERIFKIRKFIRSGKYDVVISFMGTPNFLNNFSAFEGRSWKIITSERTSGVYINNSIRYRLFSWFQHYSDYIVCNSNNTREEWNKYKSNYSDKLKVIYNPVILPKITSTYTPKVNHKINILIAASYQYLKNPIGLIKAVIMMSEEERSKIEINWYGRTEVTSGDTRAYDESLNLIKENDLENVIHLNGQTKDISNIMNTADFVALFSELEGLPNAICEGMMIGKPIIMTRVSDYDNLVDKSNGFLCDWNNSESIKNALVKASELSSEEIVLMGQRSKEKAEILFSSHDIINQWLELIES
jgi:glycosyltransferase involved in cell wall biosynthesis